MYGCHVVPPNDDGADLGVVFFHNAGYSTACGHGTIALVTWALDEGLIEKREPRDARRRRRPLRPPRDPRARRERPRPLRPLPQRPRLRPRPRRPRAGRRVDVAFGGAFYASLEERVAPDELPRLIQLGRDIKRDLERDHEIVHPLEPELRDVYGVIFWQHEDDGPPLTQRNVTVFADGEVDRSPCGSGTSARLALLDLAGQSSAI